MVMNLKDAREKTTVLQSKLYQTALKDPRRRFHQLYDKLFREDVLWSAWDQVRRNGGAPGIDGIRIADIEEAGVAQYLTILADELRRQAYLPPGVRRVEIPKGKGKTRLLGIPTVRDRIVQTAVKLVLEPIFEADFSPSSFGFRPGVGQPEALAGVHENARAGYRFVVDADIEGFFDHLDHDHMMACLRRRISDGAVLRLIYRWLKAGICVGFFREEADQGTPQGGVISPLLANIYLHGLDEAFTDPAKGFLGRLTRYADDLLIQCGSERHADRALTWLSSTLSQCGLRLSAAKTSIVNDAVEGFDFLGFHHRRVASTLGARALNYNLRWPSRKACQKFRDQIKALLGKAVWVKGVLEWRSLEAKLNAYLRGWGGYFRRSQGHRVLAKLDWYVQERVARYLARCQPSGKRRKRRRWQSFAQWLSTRGGLLRLSSPAGWTANTYRGMANIRWKAV